MQSPPPRRLAEKSRQSGVRGRLLGGVSSSAQVFVLRDSLD